MDPDETLEQIRQLVKDHPDGPLAEAVEALDTWLSNGGFLPAEWDVRLS